MMHNTLLHLFCSALSAWCLGWGRDSLLLIILVKISGCIVYSPLNECTMDFLDIISRSFASNSRVLSLMQEHVGTS
jgi:hypothetical protein